MYRLYWSPVRYFEAHRHCPPSWVGALAAPVACTGLQGISVVIFSRKTGPALDAAVKGLDLPVSGLPSGSVFAAVSLLTYPMFFGVLTLAVLALNVLAGGSAPPALLVKFTGLGFYTQVPYGLAMIAIAWIWDPEPIAVRSGASTTEVLVQMRHYQTALLSEPLLSTGRLLSYYTLLWLVAVTAVALRVVNRLSARATIAVVLGLFTIFAAGPLLGAALGALR